MQLCLKLEGQGLNKKNQEAGSIEQKTNEMSICRV